jgi:antitoxin component YwqK of YwqJK toxin-antitoxin module
LGVEMVFVEFKHHNDEGEAKSKFKDGQVDGEKYEVDDENKEKFISIKYCGI